eukprot:1157726-Pelagomonas_calceolata.AAC.11
MELQSTPVRQAAPAVQRLGARPYLNSTPVRQAAPAAQAPNAPPPWILHAGSCPGSPAPPPEPQPAQPRGQGCGPAAPAAVHDGHLARLLGGPPQLCWPFNEALGPRALSPAQAHIVKP